MTGSVTIKRVKRILPVVAITMIILLTQQMLYYSVMIGEKRRTENELSTTAASIKDEIVTKITDEIIKLHLLKTVMLENDVTSREIIDVMHIELVRPTTLFSEIDVVFSDEVISIGGTQRSPAKISFAELVSGGERMSGRYTDYKTGKDCVSYILPVCRPDTDVPYAALVGVIESDKLGEVFQPVIYNGKANICIIDATDGCYIMDSWHRELGNAYDDSSRRQMLKEYKDIDLQAELRELRSGSAAFTSRTTGNTIYMYYTPLGIFDWQLSIFAGEEALFENMTRLRQYFLVSGVVILLLLIVYFFWNIHMVRELERANAKLEAQKKHLKNIGYRDMLTSMYNRNKFIEVFEGLSGKKTENVGVLYIDLNGLKNLNDSVSHEAGDKYICRTASSIISVFMNKCYRFGGDEFVVLDIGTSESDFYNNTEKLKAEFEKNDVSAAVGVLWLADCESVGEAIAETEKRMYANKRLMKEQKN